MWTLLLLSTLPPPQSVDVRFVDLQQLVLESPLGEAAAAHLAAARSEAQARIDAARNRLARSALTPAQRAEGESALSAQRQEAEAALEALQVDLLKPILEQYDHRRRALEADGRVVARLDEVGLVGWPDICEVTSALRVERPSALSSQGACRADRIRTIDLSTLAATSPDALRRQSELDALREQRQAVIDKDRKIIELLEASAETPAARADAARKRTKLDARVRRFRERLDAETKAAREAVLDALYARLARAAARLDGVLVLDGPAPKAWGLPVEDGQNWAETVARTGAK